MRVRHYSRGFDKEPWKTLPFLYLSFVALASLRFTLADQRSKYDDESVKKTEQFLRGKEFSKVYNQKYSKLLQNPLNETHYFSKESLNYGNSPLDDLFEWHVHRFDLKDRREQNSVERKAFKDGERSQVILHCFDCDTKTSIPPWHNAVNKQTEKFFFHKVNVDTSYDPFTKRPYHQSILAVKALPQLLKRKNVDEANVSYTRSYQGYNANVSEPHFTVQNHSNMFRFNSINYKPILTGVDMNFFEGKGNSDSQRPNQDKKVHNKHAFKANFKQKHQKKRKLNKKKDDKAKSAYHNQPIQKHMRRKNELLHNARDENSANQWVDHKENPIEDNLHTKRNDYRIQHSKNNAKRISTLDDFPEQLHFLHRWLLKLDHQRYQRNLRRGSESSNEFSSPSQSKYS